MDADKLEEAIRWARGVHYNNGELIKRLADAAEAHLATLPRKVKVTRYIFAPVKAGSSHCVFETREDAERWGPLSGENIVELTGEYEIKP